jgi:ParB-like chromosome segregation protein Spo0J
MDPANVRKHSERNLESIRASLNRFGQQKPIVVNKDGVILAGNGTYAAAKSLGWKEIQVVRTDLNGADAVAYAIADNRTAELAEWDGAALAETLAALQNDEEYDHLVTGFTDAEIEALVNESAGMNFEPASIDDQGRLDEKSPIKCPHCGEEFVP